MEAVKTTANSFWEWFSGLDSAYFILAAVLILIGVIFYLLKVFWDYQEKRAVESMHALFDSMKKSPVGRVVMFVIAFFGFGGHDTDSNNHPSA